MNVTSFGKSSTYFHGHTESDLRYGAAVVEEEATKHLIFQDRQVSYRFAPHFHPYAGQLVRELLSRGFDGLQAVDTTYTPDDASLPQSVEVSLTPNTVITAPAGARVAMLGDVQATLPDGVTKIALSRTLEFRLTAATAVKPPDGLIATLVAGMTGTPPPGSALTLPADAAAYLRVDTKVTLDAGASLLLHDGTHATLDAEAPVLLALDAEFTIPGTPTATLVSSRRQPKLYAPIFSDQQYRPDRRVQRPHPVRDLDFSVSGPYALYNWELFFHAPLTIAIHLSKNQRYAEAQRWFHYLFDPTDDSDGPTPERFWKVQPFQHTDVKKTEAILVNLATGADPALRNETIRSIEAWKATPFRPHVIARYRQQAHMYKTVMAYLDNLIAWADSLFRQDTGEAVDEALMLYVLAASILGPRPQPVPRKGTVRPQTYANLRADLSQFGTAMRNVEADLGFDLMPLPIEDSGDHDRLAPVRSLGKALYFGVPRNDTLLRYWDTVADRLFKIRNSLNIQGQFRQLALFEPPIDPAMLARAAAAGVDVAAIVNGVNQPLSLVRFPLLIQKAAEICQEVRLLGSNLTAAMEKEDAEAMAILRAKHERVVMDMVEDVKYAQLQEAVKAREGLLASLAVAIQRYTFYERQLGKKPDEIVKAIPELDGLDRDSLQKQRFAAAEPAVAPRDIEVDVATDAFAQAAQFLTGGKILSSHEVRESLFLEGAQVATDIANVLSVVASGVAVVPQFTVDAAPWGVGGTTQFGGQNIASAIQAFAGGARATADRANFEARRASRIDAFARRERDWAFQSNLAAGEISQIFKQLRAAQLREAIADLELRNHRKQIENAKEIERFLNETGTDRAGKATNKALYTWMKREVKGLYAQCFQFAFDLARKAERALQHELGDPQLRYLQYGYLAGKEGLLAGEKLYLDLKRMEMAYHDLNQREYELTKHISLLQLDPLALIQLRTTGRCTVAVPEALFDLDGPGHYFRRTKAVSVSIPCVAGPYASVNCTLTLLKSSIRKTPVLRDGSYPRAGAEDDRFDDYFGSLQSITTSSGQNDAGLFETNLRDDRYLPFETSGVISEWQLELPGDPRTDPVQFDYNTISDVVLHLRYTAREGGSLLRREAMANVKEMIKNATAAGSVRLFSVRQEFPTEWAAFRSQQPPAGQGFKLALKLRAEHYPFVSVGRLKSMKRIVIIGRSSVNPAPATVNFFDQPVKADVATKVDTLSTAPELGNLLAGAFTKLALPAVPDAQLTLYVDSNDFDDLWIAATWSS